MAPAGSLAVSCAAAMAEWTEAAALLQATMKIHPLVDGNERTGRLATAVFRDLNGLPIAEASNGVTI